MKSSVYLSCLVILVAGSHAWRVRDPSGKVIWEEVVPNAGNHAARTVTAKPIHLTSTPGSTSDDNDSVPTSTPKSVLVTSIPETSVSTTQAPSKAPDHNLLVSKIRNALFDLRDEVSKRRRSFMLDD